MSDEKKNFFDQLRSQITDLETNLDELRVRADLVKMEMRDRYDSVSTDLKNRYDDLTRDVKLAQESSESNFGEAKGKLKGACKDLYEGVKKALDEFR